MILPKEMLASRAALAYLIRRSCEELKVIIESPIEVEAENETVLLPGFFPNFSSINGILVDVSGELISDLSFLESRPKAYTLNGARIPVTYLNLNYLINSGLVSIKDMLVEWGYYGSVHQVPEFLRRSEGDYSRG